MVDGCVLVGDESSVISKNKKRKAKIQIINKFFYVLGD